MWDYASRVTNGARLWGVGTDDRSWIAGFTTSWTQGDTDTLGFAWAEEGVTAADSLIANIVIQDRSWKYYSMHVLPSDPSTWSGVTIHDVPELPGFSPSAASPWDTEIEVVRPDWGGDYLLSYYNVRPYGIAPVYGSPPVVWNATVCPEVESFRFSDLPWPSSVPMDTIVPSSGQLFIGAGVQSFDADPFEDYLGWTDEEWGGWTTDGGHFTGGAWDTRYRIENP